MLCYGPRHPPRQKASQLVSGAIWASSCLVGVRRISPLKNQEYSAFSFLYFSVFVLHNIPLEMGC